MSRTEGALPGVTPFHDSALTVMTVADLRHEVERLTIERDETAASVSPATSSSAAWNSSTSGASPRRANKRRGVGKAKRAEAV
jgi:hypothetical protein